MGSKNHDGYYQFGEHSYQLGESHVTRYIYKQYIGPLEKNEEIRHLCHNPGCIEITHLTKGSHKDNIHDQIRRGTYNRQKLTIEQIKEIRKKYWKTSKTMQQIADEYKINVSHVSRIVNKVRWSNDY
jgi:AraC-like DNA-binding protein